MFEPSTVCHPNNQFILMCFHGSGTSRGGQQKYEFLAGKVAISSFRRSGTSWKPIRKKVLGKIMDRPWRLLMFTSITNSFVQESSPIGMLVRKLLEHCCM